MDILIADDDLTSRAIISAVLKKGGHEVIEAVDGLDAWQKLQRPDSPKLAIIDWMMPKMDGPELLQHIRALPTEQPPYLVMLTAKGEKSDIIAGLDAGANDYLSKPFDPGELHARIAVGQRMIEMQTALVKSRQALAYQATHDPLTGMLNRRAILDQLTKEISRADRYGNELAVGSCDIDHFKAINDTYGHQTGDDVLCGMAKILKSILRNYDSVGRMGGEEFLVIAPMEPGNDHASFFNRVCCTLSEARIRTRSGDLSITISIGATRTHGCMTVDQILETTDIALYEAKNNGRNRVIYRSHAVRQKDSVDE